ncbi:MAG: hypothetical protein GY765_15495 [bacterium]|nr:hypothetical protein [bacterium]
MPFSYYHNTVVSGTETITGSTGKLRLIVFLWKKEMKKKLSWLLLSDGWKKEKPDG